jgi:hypothetical protein
MNDNPRLNRRQFLRTTGQAATTLAAASTFAPTILSAAAPGKTPGQPNHMVDWVNCIQSRGTPKCSTDEAFIESATALMSLVSHREERLVRWDATREEIV